MSSSQINNSRIAKNTILLYIRTFFVMVVSLYTSRVILKVLGVEDYGIYQVVGGLVAMFSVISSSLSSAISRFITFEIGTGDKEKLKKIFSTSIVIQICISIIVVIFAEIFGLWFMHTSMKIPEGREVAAEWVFHCSLITFCINLLSIPYNACIIAHEHMKAFAYLSVVEVLLKLGIVLVISFSPVDRLILYAILLTLVSIIIRFIYTIYCHKHFEESRAKVLFDKLIFKEMFKFSGWSFFNNTTYILNGQGVSMLMNVAFGVTINAARGIAQQVENALLSFVNSFTTAVNPQIIKSYANNDISALHILICRSAKFSFYLMYIMALPVILEANEIMNLWLIDVPDYAVIFVQLSLIMGLCDCIGNAGYTACMATGNIKKYSLIITSIGVLEFPLTWFFFKLNFPPTSAYYTYIVVKILALIARMFLLKNMVKLSVKEHLLSVFVPVVLVSIASLVLPILVIYTIEPSIMRIIVSVVVSIISTSLFVYFIGMNKIERRMVLSKCNKILFKKNNIK